MQLTPYKRINLQQGLITRSAVGESLLPATSVTESQNFNFDIIGSATTRKGTTLIATQLSPKILGLYQFNESSGANTQLLTVASTSVYYLTGSTWSSIRTGLSASQARFTSFLNFVWMVNGTDATAIWNGSNASTFVTTGNASGAPIGKYIENFRSRVWIAGNTTYPDRLYYSSLPSAVATPIVTWNTDPTTGNFIDIAPQDGESINGLKRDKTTLLVFKTNHIYRVQSVNVTEPDPTIKVGTYSQESIVEAKDGIYFHHSSGFYRYADGSVTDISRPILDIVNNITVANYSKVTGVLEADGDHIIWSVGNVSYPSRVNNVTFTNLYVRYTISSQVWTMYTYPTQALVGGQYNDGTTLYALYGDASGNVLKLNTGSNDNGTPIFCSLVHSNDPLDDSHFTEARISRIGFRHKGGTGAKVQYQDEDDADSNFSKSIGQLKRTDTLFTGVSIKARSIEFRIAATINGDSFEYQGYEVLDGTIDPIQL